MTELVWLIPLLPLIGFLVSGLGRHVLPKPLVGVLGSGVVLGAFLLSCGVFASVYAARSAGEAGAVRKRFLSGSVPETCGYPFHFWSIR